MTALQQARERLRRAIDAVVEACGECETTRPLLESRAAHSQDWFVVAMREMENECGDIFASEQAKPLAEEYADAVLALRTLEREAMAASKKGQSNG